MENNEPIKNMATSSFKNPRKKILFANVPGDGHFNPLTGLAVHLKDKGHDVRWYSSENFKDKIRKMNIPHYAFKKALEAPDNDFNIVLPEATKIKKKVKKLAFALINVFILRGPEYFEDIWEIRKEFPFDLVVCDCAFTGIPFIEEKFGVPVISIGVLPLTETSKDLAPMGLGMKPVNSVAGRAKQTAFRFIADKVLFRKPTRIMNGILQRYGIAPEGSNIFDLLVRRSTLLLQSGTPGFEYRRSDLGKNVRFIGPLLPYRSGKRSDHWSHEKLNRYGKMILVTQGTVEKDTSKLLLPTLEAFKNRII